MISLPEVDYTDSISKVFESTCKFSLWIIHLLIFYIKGYPK